MIILFLESFVCTDIGNILNSFSIFKGVNFMYYSEFVPFKTMSSGMIFYFILGGWLHKNQDKLNNISIAKLLLLLFVGQALLLAEWFFISNNSGINWDSVFGGYTTCATMCMAVSTYILVIKFRGKIKNRKNIISFFELIGDNTLGIYYIHWIIGYTLLTYLKQNYIAYDGIILNYIKSFIIVFILGFICKKLKKLPLFKKIL